MIEDAKHPFGRSADDRCLDALSLPLPFPYSYKVDGYSASEDAKHPFGRLLLSIKTLSAYFMNLEDEGRMCD